MSYDDLTARLLRENDALKGALRQAAQMAWDDPRQQGSTELGNRIVALLDVTASPSPVLTFLAREDVWALLNEGWHDNPETTIAALRALAEEHRNIKGNS